MNATLVRQERLNVIRVTFRAEYANAHGPWELEQWAEEDAVKLVPPPPGADVAVERHTLWRMDTSAATHLREVTVVYTWPAEEETGNG